MTAPLFIANLVATVIALAATIASGYLKARRLHYFLVGLTLALLLAAIYQAEIFGRNFSFEPLRLRVHLACAFTALASFPGVAVTGFRLARERCPREVHRRWVWGFVSLIGLAILTALWMFLTAEPAG